MRTWWPGGILARVTSVSHLQSAKWTYFPSICTFGLAEDQDISEQLNIATLLFLFQAVFIWILFYFKSQESIGPFRLHLRVR